MYRTETFPAGLLINVFRGETKRLFFLLCVKIYRVQLAESAGAERSVTNFY